MTLATKSLNAVKNNYVGTIIRVGLQFFAQVLIMRQLGPDIVGTFGYALLLNGVLALIIDQGFGWSLMKGHFDDAHEIAVALSRMLLLSLICILLVFGASYLIADHMQNELIGSVLRYSAPSYLLIGFFSVTQAKLRAELRFREIQMSITGAYLVAYPIIGVAMAFAGFGVWSLVVAWYVQSLLQALIGYYYCPLPLKLANPFLPAKSGPLGRQVAGINVLNWAVDNSSGVFVGSLGASSLGNFNAASMLARTPALQIVQTLQIILFSTASALGDDQRRIKRLYLGALAVVGFIVFPLYGYALTHADLIVEVLFGDEWLHAADIFSALSLGMIALAMSTLSGAILTATGDQKVVLYSQFICLLLMIVGLYFSININLVYVGLTITAAYTVRILMQVKTIAARGGITPVEFLSPVKGPLFIAILMAVPITLFFESDLGRLSAESLTLIFKCLIVLLLFKIFPNFFFCSALVDILERFTYGRRLIGLLKL